MALTSKSRFEGAGKAGLVLLAVLLASCSQAPNGDYTDLTPTDLKRMMQEEDVYLVDTHIPEQQHIKGTDAFIPYDEIVENFNNLPEDKNIVLYCRSGSMSTQAAKQLADIGYSNIYNLAGGANAWRAIGYEFER